MTQGVVLASILWAVLWISLPAQFPHYIDDVYYKEPGYNLAVTGRFVAPAFSEYNSVKPDYSEIFAGYPPVYPGLYSFWLKLFPHSFRTSLAFDALIRITLVGIILYCFPRFLPGASNKGVVITGFVACFLGTLGRPDELGMVFAFLCLYYWWGRHSSGVAEKLLAGAFLGLCVATSPPAFIIIGVWAGYLALVRMRNRRDLLDGVLVLIGCAVVGCAILVPYYQRPGAWLQWTQTSGEFLQGVRDSFHHKSVMPYWQLLWSGFRSSIFRYFMIVGLAGLGVLVYRKCGDSRVRHSLIGLGLALGVILIGMPQQFHYYWFITPLLVATIASNIRLRSATGILLALLLVVAVNPVMREFLKSCTLPTSQKIDSVQREVEKIIPSSARVLTDYRSYYLLRAHCAALAVTDGTSTRWGVLTNADYVVFGRYMMATQDGYTFPRYWVNDPQSDFLKNHFVEIYNSHPVDSPRFLRIPIGGDPVGYGVVVYRRNGGL